MLCTSSLAYHGIKKGLSPTDLEAVLSYKLVIICLLVTLYNDRKNTGNYFHGMCSSNKTTNSQETYIFLPNVCITVN